MAAMGERTGERQESIDPAARLLVALYALFALAAGSRALYQLLTKFAQAPLAYGLSAVAALVYLVACAGFIRRSPRAWRLTMAVCAFELAGVLGVGALSLLAPDLLQAASVWSGFGAGYGYAPLLLPLLGLWWLSRPATRRGYGMKS